MTPDILLSVTIGLILAVGIPVWVYLILRYAQYKMHTEFSHFQKMYLSKARAKHATK
jgi:Flp pilus assembly protein TadB